MEFYLCLLLKENKAHTHTYWRAHAFYSLCSSISPLTESLLSSWVTHGWQYLPRMCAEKAWYAKLCYWLLDTKTATIWGWVELCVSNFSLLGIGFGKYSNNPAKPWKLAASTWAGMQADCLPKKAESWLPSTWLEKNCKLWQAGSGLHIHVQMCMYVCVFPLLDSLRDWKTRTQNK